MHCGTPLLTPGTKPCLISSVKADAKYGPARGRWKTWRARTNTSTPAYLLHRDGTVGQRYDKVRLLPLGEYMPFEDQLPVLGRVPGVSNFEAGDTIWLLVDSETPARTSFLICYEAILRDFVRTRLPEQTNLMTNVTFDDWFGDTSCPSQHLMLAAARSAELGIPLVRAATTGFRPSSTLEA